jgi:Transposase DNA-binding/Transposase DDE domain
MGTMRYEKWAAQEFRDANLGDPRRTRRLVAVGAACAAHPAGKVTEVFAKGAEREGAYRLLENEHVPTAEIGAAAHRAGVRRTWGQPHVFVPIDGSSLNIVDTERQKGLGTVGSFAKGASGLCVMTAVIVLTCGTPAGLGGQYFWSREGPVQRKKPDRRKTEDKETHHWLKVMEQVRQTFSKEAPYTRPWFQIDAGGDAWPVLWEAETKGDLLTVRAAQDRRLVGKFQGEQDYLWPHLERQTPSGYYRLEVPPGEHRQARMAQMQIQWAPVVLDLVDKSTKEHRSASVWAVRAVEIETTPSGEEPIEWMLLTRYPVQKLEDAQTVLEGYAARWRVEEFHKAWKSGVCKVEQTQLREREHIERWATIQASVAMRVVRLTYLARTRPQAPATLELTRPEILATLLIRNPPAVGLEQIPTIGQVVPWLAELGGYTGKSSGGPAGMIVITRGLLRIESLATLLSGEKDDLLRLSEALSILLSDGAEM